MTIELSREVRELYKMYGVSPESNLETIRVDCKDINLTDEQIIYFLETGEKPWESTDQFHANTQPATDDN